MYKVIIGLIFIVVVWAVLQSFFKTFRFDLIHGGGNTSSSESKAESIERGVYICDLKLISFNKFNDSIKFIVKEAWIEKTFRRGTWYWTTIPENDGFGIVILTSLKEDEEKRLHIINNRMSAFSDQEALGCCCGGQCFGTIKELPKSDTIRYNLFKEDNLDFSESNIAGSVVFVLTRKKAP